MYKTKINNNIEHSAKLNISNDLTSIELSGEWVWASIDENEINQLQQLIQSKQLTQLKIIDGSKIEILDTAGAYFIYKMLDILKNSNLNIQQIKLSGPNLNLFEKIKDNKRTQSLTQTNKDNAITTFGKNIVEFYSLIVAMIIFCGNFAVNLLFTIRSPLNFAWGEMARTINDCGAKGMLVASLLSFLIGTTLAYEMAPQFITYGANVFIVNFLGISLLKEVSPLLTAIIVAGRTGAAITAEIGTMKIQEEVDALATMGISPVCRLVIPKVLGVVIALPVITAIADIVSMLGGAIISNNYLGISYSNYLDRVQTYVSIYNYTDGIIKSFAFAIAISLTGCFCGFNVKGDANSIGEQTTKSVVLSIILVVLLDAVFAIIFNALKW